MAIVIVYHAINGTRKNFRKEGKGKRRVRSEITF